MGNSPERNLGLMDETIIFFDYAINESAIQINSRLFNVLTPGAGWAPMDEEWMGPKGPSSRQRKSENSMALKDLLSWLIHEIPRFF
jgi:hypothetical protein